MKKKSLPLPTIPITDSQRQSSRKILNVVTELLGNYKLEWSGSTPIEIISCRCHSEDTKAVASVWNWVNMDYRIILKLKLYTSIWGTVFRLCYCTLNSQG